MSTTIRTIERRPQVADGERQPPLLLLLHGYGSNQHDLMGLAPYLDPRLHIVAARGIIELGFGAAWYELLGTPGNLRSDPASRDQAVEVVARFVSDLPARLGSDPARTFVLGFSQGAMLSLALALRMPKQLAGVIAIGGYLDREATPHADPADLAELPVFIQHGISDQVVPIEAARLARDWFTTTPANLHYAEYPIGHSIHPDGLAAVGKWLRERIDAA